MFNTIVVGTDGSLTAYRAVRGAADLARVHSARLHLVSGYRPPGDMALIGPMGSPWPREPKRKCAPRSKRCWKRSARRSPPKAYRSACISAGHAADVILDVAEREQADLVVVGNRGVQESRPFLGSVPFNVLHHARCAVLVFHTTTTAQQAAAVP